MNHFLLKTLLIISFIFTLIAALTPQATEAQKPIWPKQTPGTSEIKVYLPLLINMVDNTATPTATITIEPTITTTATVSPTIEPTSTVTPTNGITNIAVNTKGAACSTTQVNSGLTWIMTYSYNLTATRNVFEANIEFAGGTGDTWDYFTKAPNDDGNGLQGNVTEVLCVNRGTQTSAKVFAIALGDNKVELARNFVLVALP